MPAPGEIELRASSSPVPAQICSVSLGAIARSPIDTTRSVWKRGRNVMPLFIVFQMPPAADATKNVRDGLGIPSTSVTRPIMFAGPIERQSAPASTASTRELPVTVAGAADVAGACWAGAGNADTAQRSPAMSPERDVLIVVLMRRVVSDGRCR